MHKLSPRVHRSEEVCVKYIAYQMLMGEVLINTSHFKDHEEIYVFVE